MFFRFFLLLVALLPCLVSGQLAPAGYVVTTSGDTLRGSLQIKDFAAVKSVQLVQGGTTTEYGPQQISAFAQPGDGIYYFSPASLSSNVPLPDDRFVRLLVRADGLALYRLSPEREESPVRIPGHAYLLRTDEDLILEVVGRPNGDGEYIINNRYRNLLQYKFGDDPRLAALIKRLRFDDRAMVDFVVRAAGAGANPEVLYRDRQNRRYTPEHRVRVQASPFHMLDNHRIGYGIGYQYRLRPIFTGERLFPALGFLFRQETFAALGEETDHLRQTQRLILTPTLDWALGDPDAPHAFLRGGVTAGYLRIDGYKENFIFAKLPTGGNATVKTTTGYGDFTDSNYVFGANIGAGYALGPFLANAALHYERFSPNLDIGRVKRPTLSAWIGLSYRLN